MTQPGPAEVMEDEPISPRWARPFYQDLPLGKSGHLTAPDGWPMTTKSSATSSTSRSPSPGTESSQYYAASTSSWATSARPTTECGFPNDDDAERCGNNKWDDE